MKQAKRGGEVGSNGEFYPGGTFLPSTRLPKRQSRSQNAYTGKALIEPGVLEVVPEGKKSIYQSIRAFVEVNEKKELVILKHLQSPDAPCWKAYGPMEDIQKLILQYNMGNRFVDNASM